MMMLPAITVLLVLVDAAVCIQLPTITLLHPQGIRFEIPDEGYRLVGLHFNINKPLHGVSSGDYQMDVKSKSGHVFVYENQAAVVQPGDTVNYWLLGVKMDGSGDQRTELSYMIPVPTPKPVTVPTPKPITVPTPKPVTATTRKPTTPPTSVLPPKPTPTVSGTDLHHTGTGSPPGTGTGTNTNTGNSVNTGNGSATGIPASAGSGGCSCQYSKNGKPTPNCQSYPCLVFEDNFDTLDLETWEHEITASGGGNWEFEYYLNNRSNSYVRDGVLYIKPTLTTDRFGPNFLTTGTLDLWGGNPGDTCTSAQFYGCKRQGTGDHPINPIQSAKLRSSRGFTFKYGKVEVEAKMPKGDWIWPAIWMLPYRNAYGQWPASGEIDIVESRGNQHYMAPDGTHVGVDSFGSTLHFGPSIVDKKYDPWQTAHVEKTLSSGTLADDFHKYGVKWTEDHIKFFFDGQETLTVSPPAQGGLWTYGKLDQMGTENPYRNAGKIAPFDQEFYLVMNVAVGGVGFFNDKLQNSPYPKPWRDDNDFTTRDFINAKNQWYPTWNPTERNGEDAAMKVNYIKVWKLSP